MNGSINVYTGNGKAKSASALGIALIAIGDGKKVFIAQFVDKTPSFQIEAIQKKLPGIVVKQYLIDCLIINNPSQKDTETFRNIFSEIEKNIVSEKYDIVIIDDLCLNFGYNLFTIKKFIDILKLKPISTEIIITGSFVPIELIEIADSITEMKEINFA